MFKSKIQTSSLFFVSIVSLVSFLTSIYPPVSVVKAEIKPQTKFSNNQICQTSSIPIRRNSNLQSNYNNAQQGPSKEAYIKCVKRCRDSLNNSAQIELCIKGCSSISSDEQAIPTPRPQ
ncbi:MAG: hypothetical protein QNJ33_11140 [Crocosphaera sp.]|nr:hypothetical protein [Crocosphaera sp.]